MRVSLHIYKDVARWGMNLLDHTSLILPQQVNFQLVDPKYTHFQRIVFPAMLNYDSSAIRQPQLMHELTVSVATRDGKRDGRRA